MVRMVWVCEVETKNGVMVVMGAHSGVITCARLVLCVWGRGEPGVCTCMITYACNH